MGNKDRLNLAEESHFVGEKRKRISSSLEANSDKGEKGRRQELHLSQEIIRHISEYIPWNSIQLTEQRYKLSPISVLSLLANSGKCNEVLYFFSRTTHHSIFRKTRLLLFG